MKKIFAVILVVVLTITVLAIGIGCETATGGETTAAATAVATAAETKGAEATAAEETTAAEVVAGEGKRFEGVDIWFDTGGPEGNPWSAILINGIKDAEKDLGCKITMTFGDWSPEGMITSFKNAVASSPDGIVIFGAPGDEAWMPLVDDAISKGIIVTSLNSNLPGLEAKYASKGFGYVGSELYAAGFMLGTAAVERGGLKSGDRGMVWGLLSQPARGERTKGCIDALKKAGVTVDYLEISPDVNADPTLGIPVFAGYVSANPDVKVVITDHGALTGTLEAYIKGAGKGPDDIYAAGFDLSPAIVSQIKSGFIDLVGDQQPYLQGYLPVLQICVAKVLGLSGLHIDTGAGLVDKSNVDIVGPLAEQGLR
jgi:simple sugar transport system substrate-binding protein